MNSIEDFYIDASSVLEEAGFQFQVGGFGQGIWPVDVDYDLAIVLQDLPDVIQALTVGAIANLDFPSQGVERRIEFEPVGNRITARCFSGTQWRPAPEFEYLLLNDLLVMLKGLSNSFLDALARLRPNAACSELTGDLRRINY